MKRIIAFGALLMMVLSALVIAPPVASAEEDGEVTITILHNNDGESNLLPNEEDGDPGVARFVTKLKELQEGASGDGVVTLTSGDNFLASKEFSAALENGTPYYDSIAMSGLYDAMALGNHDFDFGPDIAADFVSGFDPAIPFLSANADFSGEPALQKLADEGRIAASTIVETGGTKVGVIGAITPRLPSISSPRGVVISADVADAVNAEVAKLEEAGVNKIILVSHLQGLAQDRELVPQLEGVDIVIAGGGDELVKNDGDTCFEGEAAVQPYPYEVAGIPTVTGPGGYRCIGELNVTFDAEGNVVKAEGSSHGIGIDVEPDADVQAKVVEPLSEALADLTSNVLGTSEVDLDGQRPSVRTKATNEGVLLADAILHAGQSRAEDFGGVVPDVAVQNGGGIRNDSVIPAGDISAADTFDIAPFGNFVVTMEIAREDFKNLLENSVSGLPEAEGRFVQPAGFTMNVDVSEPARGIDHDNECVLTGDEGSRVRDVTLADGTKIVENGEIVEGDPVKIATIDFLARGGDCFPLGDYDFTRVGRSYQQALADYITGPLGGKITEADYGDVSNRVSISEGTADTEADADADAAAADAGETGGTGGGDAKEDLAYTGTETRVLVPVGLMLIAVGSAALAQRRRIQ